MHALPLTTTTLIAIYLRSVADVFAIVGFGLLLFRHRLSLSWLTRLALLTAAVITPVRFLPLSMGTQSYLTFLIIGLALYNSSTYRALTATGATLLGANAMILLEWAWSVAAPKLGVPTAAQGPGSIAGMIMTIPSVILLIALAAVGQSLLRPRDHRPRTPLRLTQVETRHTEEASYLIPAVQLALAAVVILVLVGGPLFSLFPFWVMLIGPAAVYILILGAAYLYRQPLGFPGGITITPAHIADFALILPTIIFVFSVTGGSHSPYKFLLLPFVLLNCLKTGRTYCISAAALSALTLMCLGLLDAYLGIGWEIQTDIILLGSMALIAWPVAHMMEVHRGLRRLLAHEASVDELTGLFNYRFLHDYLAEVIEDSKETAHLIMLDLDDFKFFNDTLGHMRGDQLLTRIARALKETVRKDDILVRYGGDEFIVVVPSGDPSVRDATSLAERICARIRGLSEVFLAEHGLTPPDDLSLSASVGIAAFPKHAADKDNLIQKADEALYRAKSLGKNRVVAVD